MNLRGDAMANKQLLIYEIETMPTNIIDEILSYVLALKQKQQEEVVASDTPMADSLVGAFKDMGIENADDIKNMRLGL